MSLIPSDRLTEADLDVWRRLARLDAIRGRDPRIARMADEAGARIAAFAERPCYLGVSWGKDSVVVAHLTRIHAPHVPLVWVRVEDRENPDCPPVRDAFLAAHPGLYEEIETPAGKRRASEEGFAIAAQRHGGRHISGVRGDESRERRIRMARWGHETERTLAPIGRWSALDVFAYLAAHDLPIHPAYAMSHGGLLERERLRVASIGGLRGAGMGRRQWELEYYPEIMTSLGKTEVIEG